MTRLEHMQAMRSCCYSLQEIAIYFGISRQRVHQLLGSRSGRARRLFPRLSDRIWLQTRLASSVKQAEIARELGCSGSAVSRAVKKLGIATGSDWTPGSLEQALSAWTEEHQQTVTAHTLRKSGDSSLKNAVQKLGGFPYWRNRLGQELRRDRPSDIGRKFEWAAFTALQAHGHSAKMQPFSAPYDILVDRVITVDVKGARLNGGSSYWFNFRSLDCDMLMLGCEAGTSIDWLIMPVEAVGTRQGMIVRPERGKWQPYYDAWHLLERPQSPHPHPDAP